MSKTVFGQVIYFPSKNALQKPVNFGLLKQAPVLMARVLKMTKVASPKPL